MRDAYSSDTFAIDVRTLRQLLPTIFQRNGYDDVKIEDASRTATAKRAVQSQDYFPSSARSQAEVTWKPAGASDTWISWIVYDVSSGNRVLHPGQTIKLGESIQFVIAQRMSSSTGFDLDAPVRNPIVAPGEAFEKVFTGTMLDYSGCAVESELSDLTDGDLPLGRYAFGFGQRPGRIGAPLYLSHFSNGGRMEYNGVLICAPQNSGKTQAVIRWARAATNGSRPHAVLIVDVKGNMRAKLEGELDGEVYCLSTDPRDTTSDRINFLDGPTGLTAAETDRIRQLATALLPSRGFVEHGGIDEFHYRNRVIWLTAFIHLLKLSQLYMPDEYKDADGKHRNVDLADLYDLIADERAFYRRYTDLIEKEAAYKGQQPIRNVTYWMSELAIMLDKAKIPFGQRVDKDTFRSYTIGLLSALEPFAAGGTLYERTRSTGRGRLFDLETALGGPKRPVTVIIAARQQDLEKSEAVLSLVIKRLQWFLFERMSQPDAEDRPVLLLLDETRRIRDFSAAEYVTFAREAKAACVVVFQSLDQIGEPAKVVELLENVGTQIYLGSMTGNTARYFMDMLPKRWRPLISKQIARAASGESVTLTAGRELVDYLGTPELYNFPAGRWPSMVYINDHPRRKPFFTDVTNEDMAIPRRRPPRAGTGPPPPPRPSGTVEITVG